MPIPEQNKFKLYEIRHGDLFIGGNHIADGNATFALLITDPHDEPILFKHGITALVQKQAERLRETNKKIPEDLNIQYETLILPVDQEIIDEVNACLENCTRIQNFKKFLTDLHSRRPDLSINPLALMP